VKSSGCGEYQDYFASAVFHCEGMAAEFVASYLLQRIEIANFLTHNRANTGDLRDALELEGKLVTQDGICAIVVVAAT